MKGNYVLTYRVPPRCSICKTDANAMFSLRIYDANHEPTDKLICGECRDIIGEIAEKAAERIVLNMVRDDCLKQVEKENE